MASMINVGVSDFTEASLLIFFAVYTATQDSQFVELRVDLTIDVNNSK